MLPLDFAKLAHKGQLRKWSAEPYIAHPIAVAALVSSVWNDPIAVAGALLHDVVEDCPGYDHPRIAKAFGPDVSSLVEVLTDEPYVPGGHPNRAARKTVTRRRFLLAQGELAVRAHTVKAADCLDNAVGNCGGIKHNDPQFWKVFQREVTSLTGVLTCAHPSLLDRLCDAFRDAAAEPHAATGMGTGWRQLGSKLIIKKSCGLASRLYTTLEVKQKRKTDEEKFNLPRRTKGQTTSGNDRLVDV